MKYVLSLFLLLSACVMDQTVSAFVIPDQAYKLVEANDVPVEYLATIQFDPGGKIHGQGPCNRYFTQSPDPYPWLKIGPIASTKMACPDLKAESQYFRLLESMTLAEASGPVLFLSNDAGESLLFNSN